MRAADASLRLPVLRSVCTSRRLASRMAAAAPPSGVVAAEPPVLRGRQWRTSTSPAPDGLQLRICTWNVLAQVYTRSSWFPWAPAAALKWKPRSAALLRDLAALRCDLLLLQEVDEPQFWTEKLAAAGYDLRYKQRTTATGAKKDGCLVAWRTSALRCVCRSRLPRDRSPSAIRAPQMALT